MHLAIALNTKNFSNLNSNGNVGGAILPDMPRA
jgi:hypothetical protein